jgi:hypothetical protein
MMKRLQRYASALAILYVLYLIKSAAGINISSQYSAPDFVKWPIQEIIAAQGRNPHGFHYSIF